MDLSPFPSVRIGWRQWRLYVDVFPCNSIRLGGQQDQGGVTVVHVCGGIEVKYRKMKYSAQIVRLFASLSH